MFLNRRVLKVKSFLFYQFYSIWWFLTIRNETSTVIYKKKAVKLKLKHHLPPPPPPPPPHTHTHTSWAFDTFSCPGNVTALNVFTFLEIWTQNFYFLNEAIPTHTAIRPIGSSLPTHGFCAGQFWR